MTSVEKKVLDYKRALNTRNPVTIITRGQFHRLKTCASECIFDSKEGGQDNDGDVWTSGIFQPVPHNTQTQPRYRSAVLKSRANASRI